MRRVLCVRNLRSVSRPRHRGSRGVASLEALFGLCVLIVLFAGIKVMGSSQLLTLRAKARARECAWLISASSCRDVPSDCESSVEEGTAPESASALSSQGDTATEGQDKTSAVDAKLSPEIEGVFKKRARVDVTESRPASEFFEEDGVVEFSRTFSIPCNTKTWGFEDITEGFMSDLMEKFKQ